MLLQAAIGAVVVEAVKKGTTRTRSMKREILFDELAELTSATAGM